MSGARFWSNTPHCATDGRRDIVVVFAPRGGVHGRERIASYRGIDVRWVYL